MGSLGSQHLRRALALVGTVVLVGTAAPALAAPDTAYQMPFPCGQSWTGSTRANHSPSSKSVDWNRTNDMGRRVMAAAPGRVSRAVTSSRSGYGRYIVIDHGRRESSLYAHLSKVRVQVGQRVKRGQRIGNVGSSGNSTGSHLHFEERVGSTVVHPFFDGRRFRFGSTLKSQNCPEPDEGDDGGDDGGDQPLQVVPLAGDWHNVGTAQLTLFHRTTPAEFVVQRPNPDRAPLHVRMGVATDEPATGDWDGNGNVNAGVFRPSTGTFYMRSRGTGLQSLKFGASSNQPVTGDWNGDGTTEVGVRDPKRSRFHLRHRNGSVRRVDLGDSNDLPVTGDWDRDGVTDLGVFDRATATFKLRRVDEEGIAWVATVRFGNPGDLPVIGDWDGNGRDDLGVWTPGTGKYSKRHASAPTNRTARRVETGTFRG